MIEERSGSKSGYLDLPLEAGFEDEGARTIDEHLNQTPKEERNPEKAEAIGVSPASIPVQTYEEEPSREHQFEHMVFSPSPDKKTESASAHLEASKALR